MNKSFMKICAFFMVMALLFFGGCGETTENTEPETSTEGTEVEGTAVGQSLASTYAADRVFSLNSESSKSFNPYKTTSAWNQVVDMLVYEELIVLDRNFEPQPNLITSWNTEDGIYWYFSVDTSRTFHDGGKLTAYDCSYSLQQAMQSSNYRKRLANVVGISTLSDESFVVCLEEADYTFYRLMNLPCIEYGTGGESRPAGTGPYYFSDSGTVLLRFEEYPTAESLPLRRIYLKEYTYAVDILQAFEDSYIDLTINNPTAMSNLGYSSSNITKYVDTTNMHYIGYNMDSAIFSQAMFRLIMTYAIDRATIVSDCMGGAAVAATLPIHPNNSLYPEDLAKTLNYSTGNLEKAIENIGVMDVDGDGYLEMFSGVSAMKTEINFIVCSDSSAKVSAARSITSNLEAVGFAVNLRELGYDDYLVALTEGDFDMYYAEVRLCGNWDLTVLFDEDSDLNYGNVHDTYLLSYMNQYKAQPEEFLQENLNQFCTYIAQQAPITVILFERTEILYHRGVIRGLEPTQTNYFYNMENWTITLPN